MIDRTAQRGRLSCNPLSDNQSVIQEQRHRSQRGDVVVGEGPEHLLVAGYFESMNAFALISAHEVSHYKVAVLQRLKADHPGYSQPGSVFIAKLPDDSLVRRHLDDSLRCPRGDQRVAILESDRIENAVAAAVLPDHPPIGIHLTHGTITFVAGQDVAVL